MSKGNYTHVQELFPEIEAMLASGKTQREVAEYFGSVSYTHLTLPTIA